MLSPSRSFSASSLSSGCGIVFEIPAELRSNWIFQLMVDPDRQKCEGLARRVILILVLPWLLVISLPVYVYLEGWTVAALHTLLVITWALLLTNIVLIRLRKIPFTCTLPLFKQHSFVTLLSCCFGFLLYAVSTPEFESSALAEPLRMLSLVPAAAVLWYIPHLSGEERQRNRKAPDFRGVSHPDDRGAATERLKHSDCKRRDTAHAAQQNTCHPDRSFPFP